MFDDEQLGFLAGDEYQQAAALRAQAEMHEGQAPDTLTVALGTDVLAGRWTDSRPGQVGK